MRIPLLPASLPPLPPNSDPNMIHVPTILTHILLQHSGDLQHPEGAEGKPVLPHRALFRGGKVLAQGGEELILQNQRVRLAAGDVLCGISIIVEWSFRGNGTR